MSCRAVRHSGKDRLRFAMPPNIEKYRRFVDGYDLDEAQKVELIHNVWAIMESFVDRAFGLHPVQLLPGRAPAADSAGTADQVDSKERSSTRHFSQAAGDLERQEGIDHEGE